MEKARPVVKNEPQHLAQSSTQIRQQVQRDIVWGDTNNRLHALLCYDSSDFIFAHPENSNEVVENMYLVTGYMQEELYYLLQDGREIFQQPDGSWSLRTGLPYLPTLDEKMTWKPMQLIRYFEADRANYHYRTDLFIAHEVKINRFKVPGHVMIIPKGYPPLMQGTAARIEFSFNGKTPNFRAIEFKAAFTLNERNP